MSLLLRNIPAVVVPSGTLPAITGSGPPITEHHSYWTDSNGHLTFGSVDLPGPPSEPTTTSQPHKNAAGLIAAAPEGAFLAELLAIAKGKASAPETRSGVGSKHVNRDVAVTAMPSVSSFSAATATADVTGAFETGILALVGLEILEGPAHAASLRAGHPKRNPALTTMATYTSNTSAGVWKSVGILPLSAESSRTNFEVLPQSSSTMKGDAGVVEGTMTGVVMAIAGILMTLGL